jgi:hypothetical protein
MNNLTGSSQETGSVINDKVFIAAAMLAAGTFDYGDIIDKTWLMTQFYIEYPDRGTKQDFEKITFEFLQNMEGFRAIMLEEHQMHLLNVRGVGYQIVKPPAQADLAMKTLKENVSKEIHKAVKTLTHINEKYLTHEDIKRRDEHQGRIAAIASFTRKETNYLK